MKTFEEYLEEGIIIKISPNISRAESLIEEANNRRLFLKKVLQLKISDDEANYIVEQIYDILIELIRAKMFKSGFQSKSHEAEVSYMGELNFNLNEIKFMDELRYFRNGIKYYGKQLDQEYAEKCLKFLKNNYNKFINN